MLCRCGFNVIGLPIVWSIHSSELHARHTQTIAYYSMVTTSTCICEEDMWKALLLLTSKVFFWKRNYNVFDTVREWFKLDRSSAPKWTCFCFSLHYKTLFGFGWWTTHDFLWMLPFLCANMTKVCIQVRICWNADH